MIDSAAKSLSTLAHDTKDTVTDKLSDKLELVVDKIDVVADKIKDADLPAPVASVAAALPRRQRKRSKAWLWILLAGLGLAALVVVMKKRGASERIPEREIAPDAFGEGVNASRENTNAFA